MHRKNPQPESLFIKKKTLAQVFSSEFFETSKNAFFTEHVWTTACGIRQGKLKTHFIRRFSVV